MGDQIGKRNNVLDKTNGGTAGDQIHIRRDYVLLCPIGSGENYRSVLRPRDLGLEHPVWGVVQGTGRDLYRYTSGVLLYLIVL